MTEEIYDALRTIEAPNPLSDGTDAETDIVSQGIVG